MFVLGLSGKIGCGKTTAANYLVKKYNFKKFSIANSLKEYVSKKYNFPLKWCYDSNFKNKQIICDNKTIRDLLINESIEVKKIEGYDVWIKKCIKNIVKYFYKNNNNSKNIVIDDVRFIYEVKLLKLWFNASIVRISEYDGYKPNKYENDKTETDLDNYNFNIKLYPNFCEIEEWIDSMMKNYFSA